MRPDFRSLLCLLAAFTGLAVCQAAPTKPVQDALNRTDPRSTVTAFLESCHADNYGRAAQYLDLRQIPERKRAVEGPQLAKQLEAILNSEAHFNVLQLSQSPEGNLADDANPLVEHVVSISRNGELFTLELNQSTLPSDTTVWLFAPSTVALIPELTPTLTQSAIEARLPHFLVSIELLDTPIWKWIVLLVLACIVISLFRAAARLLVFVLRKFEGQPKPSRRWIWIQSLLQPWLVLVSAIGFGVAEQFIDPSALSRLYIGRTLLLVVVLSFAWCLVNVVDLLLSRIDSLLDPRQRIVSHSLIYMGRRVSKVAIFFIAGIIVLDNWGYNMTTMIAGLGVGGIAIALAAQSTIANIFGGVSVISDHPVMVGDYGNFGGVLGTVEDIGMRSTRVRTLSRTLMSIPNSAFAAMNLENYALRDKILFSPVLQIKRGTTKEKVRACIQALTDLLRNDHRIEIGPSPIRLTSLSAASFGLEIFAYTLTDDIDEFYRIQADLFLEIDEVLAAAGVELV